jgi:hypothetical protein
MAYDAASDQVGLPPDVRRALLHAITGLERRRAQVIGRLSQIGRKQAGPRSIHGTEQVRSGGGERPGV